MAKAEGMTSYLTKISQVRDELATVGEVSGPELVQTAQNGVAKPWVVFVEAIVARENLPSWDKLWNDFVQEETRRGFVEGSSSTSQKDQENVALTAKGKKKFKKGPKKGGAKQQDGQKKDLSTVK